MGRAMGSWVGGGVGLLALGLAGCAALPPQGVAGQGESPAAAEIASVLSQAQCRGLAGQRAHLQAVHATLAREGMALRVLGCPQLASSAKGAADQQVLAVAVLVVDGVRAARTVRGPLADGELLDMGSAAPRAEAAPAPQRVRAAALAQPPDDALSPDVLYNRAWLRTLMGREGLRAVPDRWWAFVPR